MTKYLIILPLLLIGTSTYAATYGSNIFNSCSAAADSTSVATPANAFDGNLADWWRSANTSFPHWLTCDLGTGVEKRPAKLYLAADSANSLYIKHWEFLGSNDGTNFYTITTGTYANPGNQIQYFTFTPSSTAYRHFKINMTDNDTGGGNNYNDAANIEAYEDTSINWSTSTATSTSTYSDQFNSYLSFLLDIIVIVGLALIIIWVFR